MIFSKYFIFDKIKSGIVISVCFIFFLQYGHSFFILIISVTHAEHILWLHVKYVFKSPTQKTIDDLVTEEFNAGFESFTSKDYTDGIKHFKECLKLLKNEIVQEIYINAIYNIACCYSLLDNFEKTIKWLTKAVNTGYCNWCETIKDNDFKKIINNEQMVEIIKQMIKKNPYNHEAKIDNDIETYLELHNINYLEVNMFINIFEDIINKIYD